MSGDLLLLLLLKFKYKQTTFGSLSFAPGFTCVLNLKMFPKKTNLFYCYPSLQANLRCQSWKVKTALESFWTLVSSLRLCLTTWYGLIWFRQTCHCSYSGGFTLADGKFTLGRVHRDRTKRNGNTRQYSSHIQMFIGRNETLRLPWGYCYFFFFFCNQGKRHSRIKTLCFSLPSFPLHQCTATYFSEYIKAGDLNCILALLLITWSWI